MTFTALPMNVAQAAASVPVDFSGGDPGEPGFVAAPANATGKWDKGTVYYRSLWDPDSRWNGGGAETAYPTGIGTTENPRQSGVYRTVQEGYLFCIEPGIASNSGYTDDPYVKGKEYTGKAAEDIKLAVNFAAHVELNTWKRANHGWKTSPAALNMVIWKLLGRAEPVDSWMANVVDKTINEINLYKAGKHPNPELFAGNTKLYLYSSAGSAETSPYQVTIGFEYTPQPQASDFYIKKSPNAVYQDLVKDNPNYSLAGAQYGVYPTSSDAINDRNRLYTLTTNSKGETNTEPLGLYTYYIKEVKAPKGYRLDKEVYQVVVDGSEEVFNIDVKEVPLFDPINVLVTKEDDRGNRLEGAEFEVKYYKEMLTKDQLSGKTPDYTLTLRTGKNGIAGLREYTAETGGIIAGTPKYMVDGVVVGTLGTYTVQEVKAPSGYVLDNTLHVLRLEQDGSGKEVILANAPVVPNKDQKMRFTLKKQDVVTGVAQGDGTLQGAVYDVVVVDAAGLEEGQTVKQVTTGVDGTALVDNLPLGTYDVVESTASKGYNINPVAVRVQGTADNSGKEYTSQVTQLTKNASNLIDLFNSKVEEANRSGGRDLGSVSERPHEPEVKDNPIVITNELRDYGRISINKLQEVPDWTNLDATSSGYEALEPDIEFAIIKDGQEVDRIKTDENGYATSRLLPSDTYTLKQITRIPNLLSVEDFEVVIDGDFKEYHYDLVNKLNLKELEIVKIDAETGEEILQAGVTFELYKNVPYYELQAAYAVNRASDPATTTELVSMTVNGQRVTQFTTDSNGRVTLPQSVVPGTYSIKEVKAPEGYFLDPNGEMIEIEILDNEVTRVEITVENTPQKGQLIIEKFGPQLKDFTAEDGLTKLNIEDMFLANTKWELKAAEQIVSKDGQTVLYNQGDLVDTIVTTKETPAKSKEVPLGKYTLQEVETPKNFVLDKNIYNIEFTPQSQEVRVHSVTESKTNDRKDLEFRLTKEFEDSIFNLTPKAEFGLFLAEDYTENGVTVPKDSMLDRITLGVETKTAEIVDEPAHKETIETYEVPEYKTNETEDKDKPIFSYKVGEDIFATKEEAEAKAVELNLEVETVITGYETKQVKELIKVHSFQDKAEAEAFAAGIGSEVEVLTTEVEQAAKTTNKTYTIVSGSFKKLPIDGKFYIKELTTDENYVLDEDQHLIEFDFVDSDTKEAVAPEAKITNNLQVVRAKVSKVEMGSNGKPIEGAKFRLVAVKETGEVDLGEYVTDKNGIIEIDLPKGGHYYLEEVAPADGYFANDNKISVDISDKAHGEEIVFEFENERIPEIKTTAVNTENSKKNINPTEKVYITDRIYFKRLIVGSEYELVGILMDKATGKPLVDKQGNVYTVKILFTPETREGYIDITFEVDRDDIIGKETVVFEDLFREGRNVATHHDINDVDQTVRVTDPKLGTTLMEAESEKKVVNPVKDVRLVDVIESKDLVVGDEYELKGKIVIKDKNRTILAENNLTFTATDNEMTINMPFEVDTTDLHGKEIVAFEYLYYNGELIANHEDIEDKNQTVRVVDPKLGTKFVTTDGKQEIDHIGEVNLVDNVEVKDLVVGKTYTSKLIVMDLGTKKALLDKDGKPYTAEVEFVATAEEMMVEVPISIDLTDLKSGVTLVAFEELYHNNQLIAEEKNFDNKDQTIKVKPLVLDIRIVKTDSKDDRLFLKGAEITVFNEDGTIANDIHGKPAVGITDENGQVRFEVYYNKDNRMYAMETKAPEGYHKTDERFEIKLTDENVITTDLIEIAIVDEAITPPKMGIVEFSPALLILTSVVLFILGKKQLAK